MSLHNLNKVYHAQLQDLYSACKLSLDATRELSQVASHKGLRTVLSAGAKRLFEGMEKLETICGKHHIDPDGADCRGMRALVKEVYAQVLNAEFSDDAIRDTMIITQYQRMVHYTLAGYGCIVAFANRLELEKDAQMLKTQLTAIHEGSRQMSEIATGYLNQRAA